MNLISKLVIIFLILQFITFSQEISPEKINRRLVELDLKFSELLIQTTQIESDFSNDLEQLAKKDKELLRKFYFLNSKIKEQIESIAANSDQLMDQNDSLESLKERLNYLNVLINDVEINYSVLNNALKNNSEMIEQINDDISYLELSYDIVHKEYTIISNELEKQKIKLDSIPELYFCEECLPNTSLQINWGVFPSNLHYIKANTSFEFIASFRFNKRLVFDLAYQRIGLNTISDPLLVNFENDVVDNWDLGVIGAGIKYYTKDPVGKKYNFEALFGAIYGYGSLDNFYNQQSIEREMSNFDSYFGIYGGINVSYSEVFNKIPIEIVFGVKSFISFQEIIFDAGVNDPINVGNFMPQLNLGLRYNFNY